MQTGVVGLKWGVGRGLSIEVCVCVLSWLFCVVVSVFEVRYGSRPAHRSARVRWASGGKKMNPPHLQALHMGAILKTSHREFADRLSLVKKVGWYFNFHIHIIMPASTLQNMKSNSVCHHGCSSQKVIPCLVCIESITKRKLLQARIHTHMFSCTFDLRVR